MNKRVIKSLFTVVNSDMVSTRVTVCILAIKSVINCPKLSSSEKPDQEVGQVQSSIGLQFETILGVSVGRTGKKLDR